jgi:hypothetical protein
MAIFTSVPTMVQHWGRAEKLGEQFSNVGWVHVNANARILSAENAVLDARHILRQRDGISPTDLGIVARLGGHGCLLEGIQPKKCKVGP